MPLSRRAEERAAVWKDGRWKELLEIGSVCYLEDFVRSKRKGKPFGIKAGTISFISSECQSVYMTR